MTGIGTEEVMRLALKHAGMKKVPADSGVHVKGSNLRRVLVAIDVGVGEILLARQLGCDAVIAHHPAGGKAQLDGYKVFMRHVDQLIEAGVPRKEAVAAVAVKYNQLEVQRHPSNYDQTPVAARMLGMPLITIHSPCDEIGRKIMLQTVRGLRPDSNISDFVSRLNELPEYRKAETRIKIRLGSPKKRLGRVVVSHAAFTNGGYDVAMAYYRNGIDTLSYIHISDVDLERLAAEKHGNLVVLGHIASDWLGLNRMILELRKNDIEALSTTDLAN